MLQIPKSLRQLPQSFQIVDMRYNGVSHLWKFDVIDVIFHAGFLRYFTDGRIMNMRNARK